MNNNYNEDKIKANIYKASLAKVFPEKMRNHLFDYEKCVFGVSLRSKNFMDNRRLQASIKWISKNFKTCLVLVTDSIYRLTIQVKTQFNENESRFKALNTGLEFINEKYPLFQQYEESCCFKFQLTSEIEKQWDFEVYYQEFQSLYQNHEAFCQIVDSFAEDYLHRIQPENADTEEVEGFFQQNKDLAITYLLEESALFTCLAKAGWLVLIYPGSIKTFEEIAQGLHTNVPFPVQNMIWGSLRLRNKI